MVGGLNWTILGVHFKVLLKRVMSLGLGNGKNVVFQSFNKMVILGSILFSVIAIYSSYLYMFPAIQPVFRNDEVKNSSLVGNGMIGDSRERGNFLSSECNVFNGKWVSDESYPLYNASECPFAERGFNCLANGRKDNRYLRWRWKPKNCNLPRFDVNVVLEKLRGKRIVFVGDSLSRTQWESMICTLMTGIEDKRSVYEVNGNKITKQIRYLRVRFSSFDFTVEFYRSVFLVQLGSVPKHSPKRVTSTLKLDRLDDINNEWIDSDILVFNSGHWWTPSKLFNMGCYFQVAGKMKLGLSIKDAFKKALATWGSWVEKKIDANRTQIFFRTFEATHWSGSRQTCKVTNQPWSKPRGKDWSPFSDIIMDTVRRLSVPVKLLHVTPMGAFRSDGHVGTYSDTPSVPDCSHWCLPGVPDTWNEILFAFILSQN
ncbi:hypothetical protein LIER_22064 [Lithospermum erythrorhizon]|uniref:Trichome birefringence-like N-terminal domain-containing protein n=1 Tax=Lithospermum erythrorhizon TaxID=34254 RepID=A0AAV3QUY5_LITER